MTRGNRKPVSTIEEQRDAVDAQMPADAEVGDPAVVLGELEAGVVLLEADQQPHGDGPGDGREEEGELADQLGPVAGDHRHDQRAHRGDDDQRGEEREVGVGGGGQLGGQRADRRRQPGQAHQNDAWDRNSPTRATAPDGHPQGVVADVAGLHDPQPPGGQADQAGGSVHRPVDDLPVEGGRALEGGRARDRRSPRPASRRCTRRGPAPASRAWPAPGDPAGRRPAAAAMAANAASVVTTARITWPTPDRPR